MKRIYKIAILFLLSVAFIDTKNIRIIPKLRSLTETEITLNFKKANNLIFNANNKWEFDLECTSQESFTLEQNQEFQLTILYKKPSAAETKVLASCKHNANLKFKCTYEGADQSNLDLIKISKDSIDGKTLILNVSEDQKIPQNIILIKKKLIIWIIGKKLII